MSEFTGKRQEQAEVSVVILAGGRKDDPFARSQGVAHRSLLEIGGRAILLRMVEAFQETPPVKEIIVVGAQEVLEVLPADILRVAAAGEAAENLALGLKQCTQEWVVASPADMPWLTAEAMGEFLTEGLAKGADMVYPVVPRAVCEARFPGGRRTYVSLREGTFTGGNMVLARRAFLEGLLPLIHRLFEQRKNPLALAGTLGAGFVLRLLVRRLDLAAIEKRAARLTGGRVIALPISRAELGFDIDKPEDLEVAGGY